MKLSIRILTICAIFQLSWALDMNLTSRNFQKDFLQEMSGIMKQSALQHLDNFLREVKKPPHMGAEFEEALQIALASKKLETKIVFLKQWFDMAEHRDANRENMYGRRNVLFLKKLKDKFYDLLDESFDEIHNLRYYYLCKQFHMNGTTGGGGGEKPYHNLYAKGVQLAPINEHNVAEILAKLGLRDNHTISINITEFGETLYQKVNHTGAEVINDYLVVIRKLLQEVLENKLEEASNHNEALDKILLEIDHLLNTTDFYSKRQRLYDYLEYHLALDYEEFQNSENSQQDLVEIFEKLKQKGLDLIVAYLFSNFEFVDYTHVQWAKLLPPAPLSLYETKDGSSELLKIQQLYEEFKEDFENSAKYDAYLEAVKLLHEQTKRENADTTHIYEMLYSAAQNVGSSRAVLMNEKCKDV